MKNVSSAKDTLLLAEIAYAGDQSTEFDEYIHARESTVAPMDGLSEATGSKILHSGWHVPCHCIVVRTREGICQVFHVQPNKFSASLLTWQQEKALRELAQQDARAIVAKGIRSWFGTADARELERMKIELQKVISVDTDQWWRLLYDPASDELWIDEKVKRLLTKHKGFDLKLQS